MELPQIIEAEVNEEGCQWSVAAEQPDDMSGTEETDSETSKGAEYIERHGSPASTVLLGAPSPPPPPNTTRITTHGVVSPVVRLVTLSPPPLLMEAVWSPIAKSHGKDKE